jgi:hypothetical protein
VNDEKPNIHRKIRFTIECDLDKGEVQIQGPIQQKLLAIKILADAIHIVTDYKIVQPTVLEMPGGNGRPPLIPS